MHLCVFFSWFSFIIYLRLLIRLPVKQSQMLHVLWRSHLNESSKSNLPGILKNFSLPGAQNFNTELKFQFISIAILKIFNTNTNSIFVVSLKTTSGLG